jgi:4-amino-4-deoxy-L-arabinose transferase-like glycosyltransferase
MKLDKRFVLLSLLFSFLAGLALGALVAALGTGGFTLTGWLAAGLLSWLSFFLLVLAWRWSGDLKPLAWMLAIAFVLRLGSGMFLTAVLPTAGYDSEEQRAGYLLYDAYSRDSQAWTLATSNEPLLTAFQNQFDSDQYGGLLSLSAAVYRYLSPDVHRPLLILILAAFAGAVGIPFLYKAIKERWGKRPALIASWIMVFYPESIMLGGSEMREPFLLALISILFWAVLSWKRNRMAAIWTGAASLLGLFLFSWRVAVVVLGVMAVWFWLDYVISSWNTRWKVLGWVTVAVASVLLAVLSWAWLHGSASYDTSIVEQSSGWVQLIMNTIKHVYRIPFLTVYGLTQPVLPAALVDIANPIASTVTILRSLGWYLLAPLFIYALFTIWKAQDEQERRMLIWMACFCVIWVVISSMRAGGDMWDNPRYRSIFLPWLATLAAWGLDWALTHKDAWLVRWLIVEGIFLVVFTNWYLHRYQGIGFDVSFGTMVLAIVVLSLLVLVGGGLWDVWRKHHPAVTVSAAKGK